ncbi:carbon-nitrogen hydrolase family protein [Nocardia jinanensis]|uniref:Amidohydrolase n=1 Tax=Nocardia jinanensis TaxID=382504 RepID=A0A917VUX9_9NOCA|nr:carbon-nitrogen hydrolase family protein [Nocardia jinanensis]GGL16472.1 amidohydrolase [Nocardia jinanensis]
MSDSPVSDFAAPAAPVRVSVAQIPSLRGDIEANVAAVAQAILDAGRSGDTLIVFPECGLSGYMFTDRDQVLAASVPVSDPRLAPIFEAAARAGVHAVVGLLEADGERVYNTALLVGPGGIAGRYRKQHLPELGADNFVDPGNGEEPRVIDIGPIRVGLMICFDLRFPESARALALAGADVVAMPTNWPLASHFLADHMTRVRAVENLLYLAVADRADAEAGTRFLGRSQIIDPGGDVLVDAGDTPGVVTAEIDPARARIKRLEFDEPKFALPVFAARRPEQYGALTEHQN